MTERPIQQIVLAAWKQSAYIPADVVRSMPSVTPHQLRRYLAGDKDARLSESSLDRLLTLLRDGPKA